MLETEDSIIINNNTHVDGSNNNANDEVRSSNEHKKDYFIRESKSAGMTHSFKYLLTAPYLSKTCCNIKRQDLPVAARTTLDALYHSK